MMKTLFFTIMGFLCLSTVVAAELSVEDLEKIRQIVNEAEVRLEKRITETEVRLEKRITEIEGHLEKRIAEQSKRLDFHGTLIITLIGAAHSLCRCAISPHCISAEQTHTTRRYHKSTSYGDSGFVGEN